ncbi:MAG: nucleotidyltransferase family protein [Bacteroidales bacterium]|nr:nucleotidyltransferase family protein [Bacteroidales bacterium]
MEALVFAAGLGTRLRPVTDTIPKALVPVDGKPLLYHVVSKLKAAGIDRIVINVHHFPDSVIGYVKEQDSFGVDVRFSDERDFLLDTGGGILHARKLLEGGPFLVHNVDIISDLDIGWFISRTRPEALASLVVSERKTRRYFLFDDDMRLVGWTDTATGEVRSPYPGLDPDKCRKYAFAGIHYISDRIFSVFDEDGWKGRFPIVDFYLKECARYPVYGVVPPHLTLIDAGKPETLAQAGEFLRNHLNTKEYGKEV